eukprot:TRINITY_DN9239_c0_g1_i1.p1 TRINITY_DN9239_c0_g1~~TRINITY_DN9239_c0_g1_i1.p1  ORF type:complete len:782 (+),score=156.96 TRINITY_DN9239_c0_g1_i1:221-2347(+)
MDLQESLCNEIDAVAISCVSRDSPTHTFQMFVSTNGTLPNRLYPSSETGQYVLFRDTQTGICLNHTIIVGVFSSRPTAGFNLTMSRVTLVSNTEPCQQVLVDLPNATNAASYILFREPASDFPRLASLWINAKEGSYDVGCATGFPHPEKDACFDLGFCPDFSGDDEIPPLSIFSHSISLQEAPMELFCRITPHSITTISYIEVRNVVALLADGSSPVMSSTDVPALFVVTAQEADWLGLSASFSPDIMGTDIYLRKLDPKDPLSCQPISNPSKSALLRIDQSSDYFDIDALAMDLPQSGLLMIQTNTSADVKASIQAAWFKDFSVTKDANQLILKDVQKGQRFYYLYYACLADTWIAADASDSTAKIVWYVNGLMKNGIPGPPDMDLAFGNAEGKNGSLLHATKYPDGHIRMLGQIVGDGDVTLTYSFFSEPSELQSGMFSPECFYTFFELTNMDETGDLYVSVSVPSRSGTIEINDNRKNDGDVVMYYSPSLMNPTESTVDTSEFKDGVLYVTLGNHVEHPFVYISVLVPAGVLGTNVQIDMSFSQSVRFASEKTGTISSSSPEFFRFSEVSSSYDIVASFTGNVDMYICFEASGCVRPGPQEPRSYLGTNGVLTISREKVQSGIMHVRIASLNPDPSISIDYTFQISNDHDIVPPDRPEKHDKHKNYTYYIIGGVAFASLVTVVGFSCCIRWRKRKREMAYDIVR